ncbi:MAG: RecX family transcriptional regulator [Erysipelotrichaceae bacterium]
MRIGLFSDTYTPEINGVVSSVCTLQQELEKNGHEVFVVTTRKGLLKSVQEGNVYRLPGIEIKQLYGYRATSPIHISAIDDIKKMDLDLIHVHTEFGIGIFARIVSKRLSIPLVSTYHTTYEDYTHYINVFKLDSIDHLAKKAVSFLSKMYGDSCVSVIAPSKKTKELLESYRLRSDISVIPTGLNLEKFTPNKTSDEEILSIRQECNVDKEYAMVFIGRIAKEKSIDLVIDAFKHIKERNLSCKLIIVGGGPDEDTLKQQVKELDIEDYVYFAGKKPNQIIEKYYHAFNMFVSASLTETQGMTFIEALVAGLPVFARPDDVLKDLIKDGYNGYYFNDSSELADKIENYIQLDSQQKKLIKENGFESSKVYDAKFFYQRVIEVYENAVSLYNDYYTLSVVSRRGEAVKLTLTHETMDDLKIVVDTDSFLKYGLRKDHKVSLDNVEHLLADQEYIKAYHKCIRKITVKDRTVKEIYDFLTQSTTLEILYINRIVDDLKRRGILDDEKYANQYVEKSLIALQGENKITRSLKKKGVAIEIIEQALTQSNEQEYLKLAIKYANRIKAQIKDKSLKETKALVMKKMLAQGYELDMIYQVIDQLNFTDEQLSELDVLRKTADKVYIRYKRKYNGSKLRNAVFKGCLTRGFSYEDIYLVLNEMEWDDE